MNFKPSEITANHVKEGIQKIKNSGKSLINGTRWEVMIDSQGYPPKEIMRYAREQYDGSDYWPYGGGPATNKFLEKMGFEIRDKKLTLEELEKQLRDYFKNIWRCADSNKWQILRQYDLLTFDWFDQTIDYSNTDLKKIPSGKKAIPPWINSLKVGDLIFVMGKNHFNGIAVAKSTYNFKGPFIDMGNNGVKPAIKVEYLFKCDTPVNHSIKTHNNPTTFAGIDQYNFGLKKILDFLNSKLPDSIKALEDYIENNNHTIQLKENDFMKQKPLNQILYGPPGTGKTYKLLNEYFGYFELADKTVSKKEFEIEIITKLNWWQIIALVLLESNAKVPEIKKHRYIEYKLQVSNTNSLNQTAWGQLSSHAIKDSETVNYTRRMDPLIFDKTADSTWKIVESKKELIEDLLEIAERIKTYQEDIVTSTNYKFVTFHQSYSYEDFIEGIKPIMDDESTEENSNVGYTIEKGIFYQCCNEAAKLAGFLGLKDALENHNQQQREEKFENAPPFGLFIDEINRGNVSQIFGELITLIEEDKRLGKSEIILDLPYSKNKFGVPPNLYIIGTMNTADRSVEALDTALRRRFSFEEMTPKTEVVEKKGFSDYSRVAIMEKINKRIEVLLDRNHTLGHAYFIKTNFKSSFENEIIPLLQEYFYNDYGKIGLVLGKGFVREKAITAKNDKSIFADFDTKNDVDINKSYELIPFTEVNFDTAIQTLLV